MVVTWLLSNLASYNEIDNNNIYIFLIIFVTLKDIFCGGTILSLLTFILLLFYHFMNN